MSRSRYCPTARTAAAGDTRGNSHRSNVELLPKLLLMINSPSECISYYDERTRTDSPAEFGLRVVRAFSAVGFESPLSLRRCARAAEIATGPTRSEGCSMPDTARVKDASTYNYLQAAGCTMRA
ncbi:hypothetical protein EVAR_37318_1 [Eumeta japonica]|uniref:Uncharacterized protein n=1 Tax=Eumeta variegata TaxID=151549 RepID=A0A4C1WZ92_EUMVA|nr:hypothetical protein EVAR_37318_1 [Eumeta japonica]